MTINSNRQLRGMTWNHDRGIAPMLATSEAFFTSLPNVEISWDARPLQDFESQPLRELAENYDLIIIDHPHLGEAVREGLLVDLASVGRTAELGLISNQSAGRSHESYSLAGAQWALSVDAATAVASYRPDRLEEIPETWNDVLRLARSGKVLMPLRAPHSLMALFWIARNHGFSIAETPEHFFSKDELASTLDQFAELASYLHPDCYGMDPIAAYDAMSGDAETPPYCPHGYGYISYSRENFRPHKLRFTDVVDAGGGGVAGTVLGGTGIAVSALSVHKDIATDYAFHIAGVDCQSNLWVSSGGQPGNSSAWASEECNALCNGFLKNTNATLDAAWIRPRYEGYLEFQNRGDGIVSDFLQGQLTQKACIAALEAEYRSSIK